MKKKEIPAIREKKKDFHFPCPKKRLASLKILIPTPPPPITFLMVHPKNPLLEFFDFAKVP